MSQKFSVHARQIIRWKKEFITNNAATFELKKEAQKTER